MMYIPVNKIPYVDPGVVKDPNALKNQAYDNAMRGKQKAREEILNLIDHSYKESEKYPNNKYIRVDIKAITFQDYAGGRRIQDNQHTTFYLTSDDYTKYLLAKSDLDYWTNELKEIPNRSYGKTSLQFVVDIAERLGDTFLR